MAVNLQTIADAVGVSVATTSMALSDHPRVNDQTKQRVREMSMRLGYMTAAEIEARRSRTRRGRLLTVQLLNLANTMPDRAQESALRFLFANPPGADMRVELACTGADAEDLALHLRQERGRVDGLIFLNVVTEAHLQVLVEQDVPAVILGHLRGTPPDPSIACRQASVGMNETAAASAATELLLERGHRRIALLNAKGPSGLYYDAWTRGYLQAMARAGFATAGLLDESAGLNIRVHDQPEPPSAYVCPEIAYVPIMRHLAAERGLPFGPENVVIGSTVGVTGERGLEDYPAFLVPIDQLLHLGVRHLQQLCREPAGPWTDIHLPHARVHLHRLTPHTH